MQDDFAEQMAFLARHFDVIGPQELAGLSDAPKGRHVLVSFDDGYRDNFELAFPVLRAHGISATFFVTTGFLDGGLAAWWDEVAWMVRHATATRLPKGEWLQAGLSTERPQREATIHALLEAYKALQGSRCADFLDWLAQATGSGRCPPDDARKDWMTWDMLREMRAAGMTIGGHSVHHAVLSRLTPEQQDAEISGAGARWASRCAGLPTPSAGTIPSMHTRGARWRPRVSNSPSAITVASGGRARVTGTGSTCAASPSSACTTARVFVPRPACPACTATTTNP
jgi:peptidoglycan/xylan/chitin deacetylase (PgdA/CDA1 family)